MADSGKKKKQTKKVDPEMLKNLDLLLNMDLLENEKDWGKIEKKKSSEENEKETES